MAHLSVKSEKYNSLNLTFNNFDVLLLLSLKGGGVNK